MEFKDNLRFLRYANNMSQDELAEKLGYKSFTTVQKWEDGSAFPRVRTLNKMAEIFNIDVNHLLNMNIRNEQTAVPILGEVKAGYDMYADENIMGYEYINNSEYAAGEYFYLKVKGDSMIDLRIGDGDMVFVKKQDYIEDKEKVIESLKTGLLSVQGRQFKEDCKKLLAEEHTITFDEY